MASTVAAQCKFLPNSRPDSFTCFAMQDHYWVRKPTSYCQVRCSNLADYNFSRTLKPAAPSLRFRGKFSVQACLTPDEYPNNESKDNAVKLECELEERREKREVVYGSGVEGEEGMEMQRKATELEELGRGLALSVRPLIRVLSGSGRKEEEFLPRSKGVVRSFLDGFVRTMCGSDSTVKDRTVIGDLFRKAEADFFKFTSDFEKFLALMISNGAILAIAFMISDGNSQLDTLIWSGWVAGVLAGTMIGANQVLESRCVSGPRNVVITGSTRGLGKALAREFLFAGDRVVIASRSPDSVKTTVGQLQQELSEGLAVSNGTNASTQNGEGKVFGISCDVSNTKDVRLLGEFAVRKLGSIDIWINNAGTNKGFRSLLEFTDEDINQIVSTNLVGSLICTKEAIRVMKLQEKGGHIFNMDGAGSGGSSTPLTAVYGATKCGLRQLHTSLLKECKRSKVGIHTASPGMVLTDLLLSGASVQNKKMFNIICELPETVARALAPRMRAVKGTGKAINYLTPPRILLALVTAWVRRSRWFDEKGKALYAAETDRIQIWAENRARFSFSDAMDLYSDGSWVSVLSLSVVCAFIILSSTGNSMSGT